MFKPFDIYNIHRFFSSSTKRGKALTAKHQPSSKITNLCSTEPEDANIIKSPEVFHNLDILNSTLKRLHDVQLSVAFDTHTFLTDFIRYIHYNKATIKLEFPNINVEFPVINNDFFCIALTLITSRLLKKDRIKNSSLQRKHIKTSLS